MSQARFPAGEMMRCPQCREPMGVVEPQRIVTITVGSVTTGRADFVVRCPGTLLTRKLDCRPSRSPCRATLAVSVLVLTSAPVVIP